MTCSNRGRLSGDWALISSAGADTPARVDSPHIARSREQLPLHRTAAIVESISDPLVKPVCGIAHMWAEGKAAEKDVIGRENTEAVANVNVRRVLRSNFLVDGVRWREDRPVQHLKSDRKGTGHFMAVHVSIGRDDRTFRRAVYEL